MAVSVTTIKVDRSPEGHLGEAGVIITLKALNALPIEGVLTSFSKQMMVPDEREDPTIVSWHLPADTERYLLYGVITPQNRLWFAPSYEREISQADHIKLKGKGLVKLKTRKVNAGEWVGPPEVIQIEAK